MIIDWQKVILDLQNQYKPISVFCEEVNTDWRVLGKLARGEIKEPKFSVGIKLLDLHLEKCRVRHNRELLIGDWSCRN